MDRLRFLSGQVEAPEWTGRGSSVSSIAFLGFRELKQIDKYGHRGTRVLRSSFARERGV